MQGPKLKSALKTRTIPPIEAFATPRGDPGEQQASLLAHMFCIFSLYIRFKPCSTLLDADCSAPACMCQYSHRQCLHSTFKCVLITLVQSMQQTCSPCIQTGVLNLHQPSAPTSPAGPQSPLQQGLLHVGQRNDNGSSVAG